MEKESPRDGGDPQALRGKLLGGDDEDDDGDDEGAGITLEQILALKERFDSADVDGGGSLDMEEFQVAFGAIINKDGSMTEDQIARLFMQIDANSDGGIDWNEFSTYMLMESQSSGSIISKNLGNFFLADALGQKQEPENWHKDSADCMLLIDDVGVGAQYVTTSKDGTIRLWAQNSMQLVKTISIGHSWILDMCFLPKANKVVATSADRRLRFYDIHTWEVTNEVELESPVLCVCSWQTPDGEMLAYGNDRGEVTVVNIGKGWKDRRYRGESEFQARKRKGGIWVESHTKTLHEGWVHAIGMVADLGCLVTCSGDSTIKMFEYPFQLDPKHKERITPRRILHHPRGHHKGVKCFQWVPSHKVIVSGGLEREIVVWNPYTCKPVVSLEGHMAGITKLQVNLEFEQVISLSMDRVIKVWDLRNNECTQTISEWKKRDIRPTTMVYDPQKNRLVTIGLRAQVWKINPTILSTSTDVTHRSPVVAVLYNRMFGHVVTVAEDSETCIWRPATGQQIFSYVDTERDNETFVACAAFDDNGRRLVTGDHAGVVRVWNFSNGACIKNMSKPKDPSHREEVTGVICYEFEDKRFIAGSSWDRKVTVWFDDSDDSGEVTPYMQMQGLSDDMLTIAFCYPKSLATAGTDGSINIFDIESGYKKHTLQSTKLPGSTPRGRGTVASDELKNTLYVEKILFLENKNKVIISAGADGHIRFWEGPWMEVLPAGMNSTAQGKLALLVPAGHWPGLGLVDLAVDEENNILISADEAGFVKVWDISDFDWQAPHESQVKALYFWRAHDVSVTSVDVIVPSEDSGEEEIEPLVLTASTDKKVILWALDGCRIGHFGQGVEWDLDDKDTWESTESENILGQEQEDEETAANDDDDDDDMRDILGELDERLRVKPSSAVQFTVHDLEEVHADSPGKNRRKERDYEVDLLTGERIYKNGAPKKSTVQEERRRTTMSPYLKQFVRKLDPDNVVN